MRLYEPKRSRRSVFTKPNKMNYANALKTLRHAKAVYTYVPMAGAEGFFAKLDRDSIVREFLNMDEDEVADDVFAVRLVSDGSVIIGEAQPKPYDWQGRADKI